MNSHDKTSFNSPNTNNFLIWLKRIFSIQTISVIVAIFAAYYTYKTYEENKLSNLSIVFYDPANEKTIDIEDIKTIYVLYSTNETSDLEFVSDDHDFCMYLPHIQNKTRKSLMNFKCIIEISANPPFEIKNEDYKLNGETPDYYVKEDLSGDYDITEIDKFSFCLHYKDNVLRAQTVLPVPFEFFEFYDFQMYEFKYSITYDGLDHPLSLYVHLTCLDMDAGLHSEVIKEHLKIIERDDFSFSINNKKNKCLLVLTDGEKFYFIKNIKKTLTQSEIEELTFNEISELEEKITDK